MEARTCVAILLVEDQEHLRDLVAEFLQSEGFQVYQAKDGADGVRLFESMPRPALVLADLLTPAIDGRPFIAALGEGDRFVILPVIVSDRGGQPAGPVAGKTTIDLGDLLLIVASLCWRRL